MAVSEEMLESAAGWAEALDEMRLSRLTPDVRWKLLKPNGVSVNYDVIFTVTSGWNTDYSPYSREFRIEYVNFDPVFQALYEQMARGAINGEVFDVEPDLEAQQATLGRPTLKILCRKTGETYAS